MQPVSEQPNKISRVDSPNAQSEMTSENIWIQNGSKATHKMLEDFLAEIQAEAELIITQSEVNADIGIQDGSKFIDAVKVVGGSILSSSSSSNSSAIDANEKLNTRTKGWVRLEDLIPKIIPVENFLVSKLKFFVCGNPRFLFR